jgi:hypothetical protein
MEVSIQYRNLHLWIYVSISVWKKKCGFVTMKLKWQAGGWVFPLSLTSQVGLTMAYNTPCFFLSLSERTFPVKLRSAVGFRP